MAKPPLFRCLHRVVVTVADLHALRRQCEATEDVCHIPGERLHRYTLRGVPARLVDVAMPAVHDGGKPLVLEIARKFGRFDAAERARLTVRHWSPRNLDGSPQLRDHAGPILAGRLMIDRREGATLAAGLDSHQAVDDGIAVDASHAADSTLTVAVLWQGGYWSETWGVLRSSLADYDLAAIVMWHRERYYGFLPYDEARLLADSFEARNPGLRSLTLAEANRLASRDLYRLARDLGWRKLTLRERTRYGFGADCGQWLRVEQVERRRADLGYPSRTGAGQYTTEAAHGQAMTQTERDGYIQTSHGLFGVE